VTKTIRLSDVVNMKTAFVDNVIFYQYLHIECFLNCFNFSFEVLDIVMHL